MKIDIIDVLSGACETVVGRIFVTFAVIIISGAIGLMIGDFEDAGIVEALASVVPVLFISLFAGIGIISLPILFGFTIMFVRLEWNYIWLFVPAAVSFYTSLYVAS